MALKAKISGRAELTRNLRAFVPNALVYAADANYRIAEEVADKIREVAPRGATLEYAEAIHGDFVKHHPGALDFSDNPTKDKDAAGLFAPYIWRFLEWGTAPHNTAAGGGTVKGRSAFSEGKGNLHPGTAAQPHIYPTWRSFKATAVKIKRAAIAKAIREFNRI
ncbi:MULTISPECIES: HK97 gp10 family phage protein [unclassified Rhizobium]|uniref:HK97 gp10 family phage protein n=1 Tax=unclassified Rhizobium TaxID=2613769 RepID=UPI001ADA46E0|nr:MULTISPECIES: HK97 gp10 family phage protein [unclassified Rhizobium]MBO9124853.1 HK97 gp10 family phage protein [Rhizobium sp. 16-488-2b]MBO9175437.1 HK97 gp10 family phage protein [Rhizobium sp. 16-488-2a]